METSGPEKTAWRLLTTEHVGTDTFRGEPVLMVEPQAFELLAREAFAEVSFFFRTHHVEGWAGILDDPEASANDRFVAGTLLRNAMIAAAGVLPSCQDTGTATVVARKGHRVVTDGSDARHLERGIARAWRELNLRYSQLAPLDMYSEQNTGTNLPAQIDLYADSGDQYEFLFVAKGGGSANKTAFFQETAARLRPGVLADFLVEKIAALGTAACPPYHIAIVVGGTSAEANLKTVKLASAGALEGLPASGSPAGTAFRDVALEEELLERSRTVGLGAQYGGRCLALDVRVVRLPRHAASLPIGIGVSCSADRNIKAAITAEGILLEELDKHPERFRDKLNALEEIRPVPITTDQSIEQVRAALSRLPVGTLVSLSGTLIVARDAAHARIAQALREGRPMPEYFRRYPVYYAGPSKTPPGMVSGSFGPTTSQRMDGYVAAFMQHGGSLIMLGKGNRSPQVAEACKQYGGFYLGTIGGAAAIVAQEYIREERLVDFEELGMEAVRQIRVENMPAFIVGDDKGTVLYGSIA